MYVTVSLIIIIILASAAIYLACLLRRYRLSAQKKEEYVKDLQEISTKNTSLIKKQSEELLAKNLELTRVNDDMVELLGNVVELRDRESGEHVIRVKTYTNILARYVMENFPR